jgi:hypothetical protein
MVVASGEGSASLQDLQPSRISIQALLGQGGFAACYRATYQDDPVAVKVIPRHVNAADKHAEYCRQSFLHECLLVAGLRHEYDPPRQVNDAKFPRL